MRVWHVRKAYVITLGEDEFPISEKVTSLGNNGVRQPDRCRWILGQQGLPARVMSAGGRFLFDDDGQTPNTQIVLLDYKPAPILCEIRGLPERSSAKSMDKYRSLTMGMIVQCEGGACIGNRSAHRTVTCQFGNEWIA